jgi:hypothetical protein
VTVFRRFPVLLALILLFVAALLTSQIAALWPNAPAPLWWVVMGLLAAGGGILLGLPRWWLPFQLVAPSAFALLLTGLSPWVSLVIVIVLLLLYGGGVVTRVPLYLSNTAACVELAKLLNELNELNQLPAPIAIDLGAGFGGPMRFLGRALPRGRFCSVEASPATWLVAWVLAITQRNVAVRWGDLWASPLGDCDLVYVFLSPQPMPRLWEHFQTQAKSGALLVSNTFPIPGVEPLRVLPLPGRGDARLFIYRQSSK